MRALNIIGIFLINLLASKKLLIEIETGNKNETGFGSDYSMIRKGKFEGRIYVWSYSLIYW